MTGTEIIAAGLGLAGNSSLSATLALDALNRGLQKLYQKKLSFQRLTASVAFGSGVVINTANWDTKFLDFYEHEDGTVGRYSDAAGAVTSLQGKTYRQYINIADRLTATGPPRYIAADRVGAAWYVYPKTDQAYTVSVDYYQLPVAITAGQTPLASTWGLDDILVEMVKVWAYEWQDDARYENSLRRLVGEVGAYRRKDQAREGIVHQTALDPRIFRRNPGDD